MSVYPEDFEIHADQLIYWWLGDGLIRGKDDDSKTAVELGYEHLAKLANRCLLEVVKQRDYDGRIHKFRIHDMVRELITKITEEQNLCNFSGDGMQIMIEDSRWLCLTEDMAAEVKNPWNKRKTKLRALLLMSRPSLIDFSKNFVLLESLRVLDLSYSKLDVISVENSSRPSSGICGKKLFQLINSLKRLACLNLSGVQNLSEVTSNIKKLLNLQVFVLKGCENLVKIHSKISSLKRLVVLDLGKCPLQDLPRELGSLYCLQELSGFRVVSWAKIQGCTLLERGKLEQLRVLRITICDLAEISDKEKKSLSSLKSLKVLDLDADTCKGENLKMIDELELPPKLEELYLSKYRSPKMPKWFSPSRLDKLNFLSIDNCDFESLQEKHYIWNKIEGSNLKLLDRLNADWIELKSAVPALCYMEISSCPSLKKFPIEDVVKGGVWKK
ncbi:hypothetical protein M0R45_026041 [Rubus argutus]|uniref:Uncharacterized protein n=1 Tax=Rubus argutus TaxID=59490 RepID=A0AAW1WY49_RUBAR